jgi:protein SCO1/2
MAKSKATPDAATIAPPRWATVSPREAIHQRYFADMRLTTHEGKSVRLYEDLIKDKIVLLNFMYAHCEGICIPVTSNLLKVQALLGDRVGRDIFMYSFTLKPKEDTPEVLRDYARAHGVGPGWTFLTGEPSDLETLRRRLGFTDPDPARDADKTNHTGMVRYGNEALQLWAAFPGMSKAEAIAKQILWVDWPKAPGPGAKPGEPRGKG